MNKEEYLLFLIENAPFERRENLKKYLEINKDNEMIIFDLYILSKIKNEVNFNFNLDTTKYVSYDFAYISETLSSIFNYNEVKLEFERFFNFENYNINQGFIRNMLQNYVEQFEVFLKNNNIIIGKNFSSNITKKYDNKSKYKSFNGFYLRVKMYNQ